MDTQEILPYIRKVRKEQRITQEWMGKQLQISQSEYSRVERGIEGYERFIPKACELLKIEIAKVVPASNTPNIKLQKELKNLKKENESLKEDIIQLEKEIFYLRDNLKFTTRPQYNREISYSLSVLGFADMPTKDELRQRFRELMTIFHPDKNSGGEKQAQVINQANNILIKVVNLP